MKRVSIAQMKALESQADANGLSYEQMMANAGLALAQVIQSALLPTANAKRAGGLVGSGNNGGDCLIALRHLAAWGWQTQAYLLKARGQDDTPLSDYRKAGGEVLGCDGDTDFRELRQSVLQADLVLDGVLGMGVKLPLKGEVQHALAVLKDLRDLPPVIAVDCPSGVDCDNGKAAQRMPAGRLDGLHGGGQGGTAEAAGLGFVR